MTKLIFIIGIIGLLIGGFLLIRFNKKLNETIKDYYLFGNPLLKAEKPDKKGLLLEGTSISKAEWQPDKFNFITQYGYIDENGKDVVERTVQKNVRIYKMYIEAPNPNQSPTTFTRSYPMIIKKP